MNGTKNKSTHNRREKLTGFVYVSLMFIITTGICCICMFYYGSDNKNISRKKFAISKMERIRTFQKAQSKEMVIIDSIYSKIADLNLGLNASYEENDIKYYLNDLKHIYESNSYDGRYKIFQQTSSFYRKWFEDRKELWSKYQNINNFRNNLEQCEIGLKKKTEEIRNTKK